MDGHDRHDSHTRHHKLRRRSVSIPRGFLDYAVLSALSREPLSGKELMDDIEGKSNWRPSPGSIYPLLRKLSKRGSIEEVESGEPGLKSFVLTESGEELLEDHRKQREFFREKYHSIRRMWLRIYEEMDEELYQANLRLFKAVEGISAMLKKGDRSASETVQEILERAAKEIEEEKMRLEEEKT
jgi:DNA-binding PadR family transcriptional regulator